MTRSVLQDWVMELPLREQGSLLTGIRGCDLAPKDPYVAINHDVSPERKLAAFLRHCTLVPADTREVNTPGSWYETEPPSEWKPSQMMHYPLHWYSHLLHCYEIVAYRHPDQELAIECEAIYLKLVSALHLNPETKSEMIRRLSEDRIASGEIVS